MKEALGCKFAKHIARNDNDEDGGYVSMQANLRGVKCSCCKQLGHIANVCPKDPNLKTLTGTAVARFEQEEQRISKNFMLSSMNADSLVQTTHFLKKCALETRNEESDPLKHVFKKGAMLFEDYNYAQINPYILVESLQNMETLERETKKDLDQDSLNRINDDYEFGAEMVKV